MAAPISMKGKNILVTGGGSGLGKAYVEGFRALGSNVLFGDISNPDDLQGYIECDVASWDSQLAFFEQAGSQLGQIDVVIANAGIASASENVLDFEDDQYPPMKPNTKAISVNLEGVLYTTKLALYYFRRQRTKTRQSNSFKPIVILGGSLAGYIDMPTSTVYASTKFGVRGLLHSLKYSATRIDARLAMIAPWHVDTPQLGPFLDVLKGLNIPLARIDDVVSAAKALIEDQNSNGKCLAPVPKSMNAPMGYIDVQGEGQERVWESATKMLVSEDPRPQLDR